MAAARRRLKKRGSVPTVAQSFTQEQGIQMVKDGAIVGDLAALAIARIFKVRPETEANLRLFGSLGGGAYGVYRASELTQAHAARMHRRYAHLKLYTPPAAPYTVDMR